MKMALAKSSIQTGILLGLRVATQAVTLTLLTRLLGATAYGNFAAVATLAVVLGLLPNLGAGFVMLARGTAAEEATGIADVWSYAWPMTVLLGILLLTIFATLARLVTPSPLPTKILLELGAAELILTPFSMLFSFALQAGEYVPRSQFVQWLPLGLRIIASFFCFGINIDERLPLYALLQLIASGLGVLLGYYVSIPFISISWKPRLATVGEIRKGASYAFMNLIAANPSELDKIAAARTIGPHDAGIYAATARVMSATVMPVTALLLASQPRMFRHSHTPNEEGHRLIRLIAVLAFIWGTVAGLILVLSSPWLPWLFGKSFEASAKLMPWLAGCAPLLSLRLAAGTVLVAHGQPAQRIAFEICGIAVLVATMLLLAPLLGMEGIAIALILAELSMVLLGWWLVVKKLQSQVDQFVYPG